MAGEETMTTTIERENKYTSGLYVKRPIAIVRGQGALVWDENGREYIDCVAGQGSANLGHCHPAVVKAITEQAQTLMACTEMFYFSKRAELEQRLVEAAGGGIPPRVPVQFGNRSGGGSAEAGALFHRPDRFRRGQARFPRPDDGRALGDLE